MDSYFLTRIKNFEGYTREAKWDYAQYSNGFGTKAAHLGEVIEPAEAERRFRDEISRASALVEKFAPDLDTGSRAALTSLTFNAGTKWMRSGLGEAITSGDFSEAKNIFLKYTKAGGADLPGLVSRRLEEVTWFQDGSPNVPEVKESQDEVAALATDYRQNAGEKRARSTDPLPGRPFLDDGSDPIVAAYNLFEQLEMDRLRLLVLSERSVALEKEDRRIL